MSCSSSLQCMFWRGNGIWQTRPNRIVEIWSVMMRAPTNTIINHILIVFSLAMANIIAHESRDARHKQLNNYNKRHRTGFVLLFCCSCLLCNIIGTDVEILESNKKEKKRKQCRRQNQTIRFVVKITLSRLILCNGIRPYSARSQDNPSSIYYTFSLLCSIDSTHNRRDDTKSQFIRNSKTIGNRHCENDSI